MGTFITYVRTSFLAQVTIPIGFLYGQFYKAEVIKAYRLKNSQARVKNITDSPDLLAVMTHNIAYDEMTLPDERVRLVIAAYYLVLGYTGCRPAEIVDGEKKQPKHARWYDLFESRDLLQLDPAPDLGFEDDLPRQSPLRPMPCATTI